MRKTTGILLVFVSFFAGAFIGFLISPAKQGFGTNNTNYYYASKAEDSAEESK